ncbi:hypothetical protein OESDEN_04101 [Oesophagostomum dentatum]|uniref:Uncharacterized protein n=1 Tax=Oesophagostomum dentatum TaxID=61180 RepID=A0A0B1TJD0_OESDE|nr:hypothetical protein OESDEN_04101 [Oesophagostomum dentatum]
MKNFGVEHQVLIVSYTHSVDVVSALYGKHQHVIGVENANYAVDLIVEFVKGKHGSTTKLPPLKTTPQSTISKLPDSSTTTSDYVLSTESSTQETTVKLSTSHLPELTTSESTQMSPVSHTRPASTSAIEATTQIADLSTTPETSHSSKIVTTSAIESTAQMKTSTKPEDSGAHCLFAADLFNFGRRGIASEKVLEEKNSLLRIAELLLNNVTTSSVGLWVYGYVRKQYKWRDVFNKMTSNYLEFWIDASDKMQLGNLLVPVDNDA